jgi:hypothetical protein
MKSACRTRYLGTISGTDGHPTTVPNQLAGNEKAQAA